MCFVGVYKGKSKQSFILPKFILPEGCCGTFEIIISSLIKLPYKMSRKQVIFGGRWEGSKNCIQKFETIMAKSYVLNIMQSLHMCEGIERITEIIDLLLRLESEEFSLIEDQLFVILSNCYSTIESCRSEVISHVNNKEIFREYVGDINFWLNAASEVLVDYYPNHIEGRKLLLNCATAKEVNSDTEDLLERMVKVVTEDQNKSETLAFHALQRLKNLRNIEFGEMNLSDSLINTSTLETIQIINNEYLGRGSFGKVYQSNWLGLQCAIKILPRGCEKDFFREANILMKLSHPNVISYYFATIVKDEFIIGMELMDLNLHKMLKNMLKNKEKKSDTFWIDVMYQVAKAMCYLHDMHIAHRDLKPHNILVNVLETTTIDKIVQHAIVKVIDFGMSQVEVGSKSKKTKYKMAYGTDPYRAPELLRTNPLPSKYSPENNKEVLSEPIEVDVFQADVYSFGMVCANIISTNYPFFVEPPDYKILIDGGVKPSLPSRFNGLNKLIEDCRNQDHCKRPKFPEICERLNMVKKEFILARVEKNTRMLKKPRLRYHQKGENQKLCSKKYLVR